MYKIIYTDLKTNSWSSPKNLTVNWNQFDTFAKLFISTYFYNEKLSLILCILLTIHPPASPLSEENPLFYTTGLPIQWYQPLDANQFNNEMAFKTLVKEKPFSEQTIWKMTILNIQNKWCDIVHVLIQRCILI